MDHYHTLCYVKHIKICIGDNFFIASVNTDGYNHIWKIIHWGRLRGGEYFCGISTRNLLEKYFSVIF